MPLSACVCVSPPRLRLTLRSPCECDRHSSPARFVPPRPRPHLLLLLSCPAARSRPGSRRPRRPWLAWLSCVRALLWEWRGGEGREGGRGDEQARGWTAGGVEKGQTEGPVVPSKGKSREGGRDPRVDFFRTQRPQSTTVGVGERREPRGGLVSF